MILLQPQRQHIGEYEELAKKYGLKIELMDAAFCSLLDNKTLQEEIRSTYDPSLLYSCHGVFADLNFSGSDPLIYQVSKQRLCQCAAYAVSLGIEKMVIHSCFHPVLHPDDPLYEIWSCTFAELLCQVAERYQLELYVENVMDQNPYILSRIMEAARHPKIKVCLDIGHANLSACSLEEWFLRLHEHLSYMHLSDNGGLYDEHLPVGQGNVDWMNVKKLIHKYNIKADYTIEVTGTSGVLESIEYLRVLWGELF